MRSTHRAPDCIPSASWHWASMPMLPCAHEYRRLTWEDATARLLEAGQVAPDEWPTTRAATKDAALWTFYKPFTGIDILRTALGAHVCAGCCHLRCHSRSLLHIVLVQTATEC